METYVEFLKRINSFEKKQPGFGAEAFKINPSLCDKVSGDNAFKPFYGDTAVFDLDGEVKARLGEYVDLLYNRIPECFCERLSPQTLHMTLHDLGNSAVFGNAAEESFNNELKVAKMAAEFKKFNGVAIRLRSKYIFNMMNNSLVLGLYPIDEENYLTLAEMYSMLDGIKKLSYPFTPHVTLAYYNVNGFDARSAAALEDSVERINAALDLTFSVRDLYYQKFVGMSSFTNIINLL